MTEPAIVSISLPICSYGFRSGYAYAYVNGVHKKLHTSESDQLPWDAHALIVRAKFASGEGELIYPPRTKSTLYASN